MRRHDDDEGGDGTSGTPADDEDTRRMAGPTGVHPMIETYPLGRAAEGDARMPSGQRLRVVPAMCRRSLP